MVFHIQGHIQSSDVYKVNDAHFSIIWNLSEMGHFFLFNFFYPFF